MCSNDLSSSTRFRTSWFVTLSLQLIFSIRLHVHISNASTFFLSALFIVQHSAAYVATVHISVFIIFFFRSKFMLPVNIPLFSMKAHLPWAILLLMSFLQYPSSVITLPRYLNRLTCSIICPSINIFIPLPFFLAMHITLVFLTLIFIPYFLETSFILSTSSLRPLSLLDTIALSSAYLIDFIIFPPTNTPRSTSFVASRVRASSYMMYSNGDSAHPCLTPLPI